MLSYAGVTLPLPTPEILDRVSRFIRLSDIIEFANRNWPGPRLANFTFNDALPEWYADCPVTLCSLTWPVGASRFAIAHYVVSTNELDALRTACYGAVAPAQLVAQNLILGDGTNTLTFSMFMLPPRPLTNSGGADLYLVTLTDKRLFWQQAPSGLLTITPGTTTWEDVYGTIAAALGISITVDAINAAYLKPSTMLNGLANENLGILLDAVAYNCGQRIVCSFDGTSVRAMNLSSSLAIRNSNAAITGQIAGGTFGFDTII